MAQIGWIDFSTADRKRMSQAMSLIRPEGQLDELGIGRIRDGIADRLFPGISTIQTRAKYFFIVPYILRDYLYLSAREKSKTTATRYLEDTEHEIKNKLRSRYLGNRNTGIIGITLPVSQRSVRQPSEIYWVGISSFGCMENEGLALSGFLRNLNQLNQHLHRRAKETDEDDDPDAGFDYELRFKVPSVGAAWKESIDIHLTPAEAEFLKKQLLEPKNLKLKDSLLPQLFRQPELLDCLVEATDFSQFSEKAIQLPALPSHLKKHLILAHDFAVVIHGAHILYNHLLQEHFFEDQYEDFYLNEFELWRSTLKEQMVDFDRFQVGDLSNWLSESRFFVNSWWDLVRQANPSIEKLKELIALREFAVKGKKARLRNSRNDFAEMALDKWIGLQPLQYRFGNAKRIILDILNPAEDV